MNPLSKHKYNAHLFLVSDSAPSIASAEKLLHTLATLLPDTSLHLDVRSDGLFLTSAFNKASFGLFQRLIPTAEFIRNPGVWCVDVARTSKYTCQEVTSKGPR